MNALALVVFFILVPLSGGARTPLYAGVEDTAFDSDDGDPGSVSPTLIKVGGKKITAPAVEEETGYQDVQFSADRKRAGWIVRKKLFCCSAPLGIVIFKGDRIERVIDETCLRGWMFRDGGSRIAYEAEPCHLSSGPFFVLLDVATGKRLDHYSIDFIRDDVEWDRVTLPHDAPAWVSDFFSPR